MRDRGKGKPIIKNSWNIKIYRFTDKEATFNNDLVM